MTDEGSKQTSIRVAGAIVTVAAAVLLYWLMFYDAGYQAGFGDRKAQTEAGRYEKSLSQKVNQNCRAKPAPEMLDCIAEIVVAQRENIRGESDLAAQWEAARWVKLAGFAAMAQLLATIIGLYYIKGTLEQTRKAVIDTSEATAEMHAANKIAEDNYLLAHRPWIKVELVPDEPAFLEADQFQVHHRVRLINIGNSPAAILHARFRNRAPNFEAHGSDGLKLQHPSDFSEFFSVGNHDDTRTYILPGDFIDYLHSAEMKLDDAFIAEGVGNMNSIMFALDINCIFSFEAHVFRSSASFLVTLTEEGNNGFVKLPAESKKEIEWIAAAMLQEYA